MAVDLEQARVQLEQFVDQSGGGWMTDEANLTAVIMEMKEAGLIDAEILRDDAEAPLGAIVSCVTQDGHQFLAATKTPQWATVQEQCRGKHLREAVGQLLPA
jgi:hypothetical protein